MDVVQLRLHVGSQKRPHEALSVIGSSVKDIKMRKIITEQQILIFLFCVEEDRAALFSFINAGNFHCFFAVITGR
jgi:ribonuclease PH